MITKFLPLPADSGDKQRASAVLKRLASLGEVTICAFDDGKADHRAIEALGIKVRSLPTPGKFDVLIGVCKTRSISSGRFWSRALARALDETVSEVDPDCLLVSYAQLAPHGSTLKARYRILDLHNIESALFASYADSSKGLRSAVAKWESKALDRIERRAMTTFDTVMVVSDKDRRRLPLSGSGSGGPDIVVCPNGWDPSSPAPMGAEPVVAFIALMGWAPNADAAVWLVKNVWPLVTEAVPDAQLLLVGRDPAPSVQDLASDNIVVTGTVPEIAPYLSRARVAVAPLLAGGGSRLKILEALNAGRPVVATSVGAEALEQFEGHGLVIADEPQEFADAVVAYLNNRGEAEEAGRLGNAEVAGSFSWDTTLGPLARVVERIAEPRDEQDHYRSSELGT